MVEPSFRSSGHLIWQQLLGRRQTQLIEALARCHTFDRGERALPITHRARATSNVVRVMARRPCTTSSGCSHSDQKAAAKVATALVGGHAFGERGAFGCDSGCFGLAIQLHECLLHIAHAEPAKWFRLPLARLVVGMWQLQQW